MKRRSAPPYGRYLKKQIQANNKIQKSYTKKLNYDYKMTKNIKTEKLIQKTRNTLKIIYLPEL